MICLGVLLIYVAVALLDSVPYQSRALVIAAGNFGGWIEDLIQYVYTTLSSIPNILLITAVMLIVTSRTPGDRLPGWLALC
jgi:ABC-type dipeptide/oligopeptide/nickel transport system permease subunit